MKLIISISLILFSVFVSAQSQVKLIVIDGYTNEPMSNCEVQLTKKNNKLLTEFTSSEGIIEIELSELKNSKLEIIDGQNHFLRYYFEKYKTNPDTILVHMIPTVAYEEKMFELENKKFGKPVSRSSNSDLDSALIVLDSLDVDAFFGSGPAELREYLSKHVNYPLISRQFGDQGIVYVHFIVEKNGTLTHVGILRSVSDELDNEAKRVVRSMRYWNPGESDGKKVRTYCTLPIRFVLD